MVFRSQRLAARLGMDDLWLAFSGWWPEHAARMETCSFKGLEAAVVVLVVDGVAANNSETAYVAVTRARSRLFVIGSVRGTRLGTALERASQPAAGN